MKIYVKNGGILFCEGCKGWGIIKFHVSHIAGIERFYYLYSLDPPPKVDAQPLMPHMAQLHALSQFVVALNVPTKKDHHFWNPG